MSDTQWVQHKSGVGEKLQLVGKDICQNTWVCWGEGKSTYVCYLPKSEYVHCDPPERWVDVTEECDMESHGAILAHDGKESLRIIADIRTGYRFRKVYFRNRLSDPGWAFIVEKKEG